jgi:serine/threonine-protein kinase
VQITREVADALDYAHRQDVIHRDIKPENILLQEHHAVVADFGIARAVSVAASEELTQTGFALGTPTYMSLEQSAGERNVDGRSDIYSLGCVLYEMLGGDPPFTASTPKAILARKAVEQVPSLRVVRETVPDALEQVVMKSLAKTPADRFSSAGQLATALAKRESAAVVATPMPVTRPTLRSWRRPALLGMVLVVVVGAALVVGRWVRPTPAGEPEHPWTAIAVLPFENVSADGPYAYFAGGLHDELLTQLAKVAALSVRGRTSVMGYAGTDKSIKEVAQELEVGTLVEGSVQVMGDRLRVNVQLIDAATDESLWAESYNRTLDDAFAIQSDIAQQIVGAVGAALTEAEVSAIAAVPTDNAEAYDFYLQGEEYRRRPGVLQQNLEIAQQLYEQALELDSTFALAHAAVSRIHAWMSWFRFDTSPARLARQREEAETALRLAPDLPQGHIAMGLWHQTVRRDYRRALDEFATALEGLPNDADVWYRIAVMHRRLGNWDEALAAFERAAQLDPRNAQLFLDLGNWTNQLLHRYAEAVRAIDRALTLAPDLDGAAVDKGWVYVLWRGELDMLRAVLDRVPPEAELGFHLGSVIKERAELLLLERQADSLLGLLATTPRRVMEHQVEFLPTSLYAAWAHQLRADGAAARLAFDSARVLLDSVMIDLPDDYRVHAARGLALAGLGQRDEALREARWLEQSLWYREDAFFGPGVAHWRAKILAQLGEAEAALDEIERLLVGPSTLLSAHTLRLDPRWDPIRDDPRFQALLEKYGN